MQKPQLQRQTSHQKQQEYLQNLVANNKYMGNNIPNVAGLWDYEVQGTNMKSAHHRGHRRTRRATSWWHADQDPYQGSTDEDELQQQIEQHEYVNFAVPANNNYTENSTIPLFRKVKKYRKIEVPKNLRKRKNRKRNVPHQEQSFSRSSSDLEGTLSTTLSEDKIDDFYKIMKETVAKIEGLRNSNEKTSEDTTAKTSRPEEHLLPKSKKDDLSPRSSVHHMISSYCRNNIQNNNKNIHINHQQRQNNSKRHVNPSKVSFSPIKTSKKIVKTKKNLHYMQGSDGCSDLPDENVYQSGDEYEVVYEYEPYYPNNENTVNYNNNPNQMIQSYHSQKTAPSIINTQITKSKNKFEQVISPEEACSVQIIYILHCWLKIFIDLVFLYLTYEMGLIQSQSHLPDASIFHEKLIPYNPKANIFKYSFNFTALDEAIHITERFVCRHGIKYDWPDENDMARSPCINHQEVLCWVGRAQEKEHFVRYIACVQFVAIFIAFMDIVYTSIGMVNLNSKLWKAAQVLKKMYPKGRRPKLVVPVDDNLFKKSHAVN